MTLSTEDNKGRYDDLCTEVREKAKARGAILIIFHAEQAPGFSVQASLLDLASLPSLLRRMADDVENDLAEIVKQKTQQNSV